MPLAVCGVVLVSACGGGRSDVLRTNGTLASPSFTTAETTASASPTAPADPETAQFQIMANWTKFFDYRTPRDQKLALLENGDRLGPAMDFFDKLQQTGNLKQLVRVHRVRFTSPTQANVRYALLNDTQVLLPSAQGVAVLVDNVWKVGQVTFCTLAELGSGDRRLRGC